MSRFLRREAGTASEGQADMHRHAEQSRAASKFQAPNQEPRSDPKEGLPEMARPIQQAVVAMVQYTVEFQDRLLRRAH